MSNSKISAHLHTVSMYKLVQVANTTLDPAGNTVADRLGICIGGNASHTMGEYHLLIDVYRFRQIINTYIHCTCLLAHMCKYMYIQGIVIIHVHNVYNKMFVFPHKADQSSKKLQSTCTCLPIVLTCMYMYMYIVRTYKHVHVCTCMYVRMCSRRQ